MSGIKPSFSFINISGDFQKKSYNKTFSRKKKYSNFQKSKYIRMIANAESNAEVRNIKAMLKKEACKAENCEDAKAALQKIRNTMNKASEKLENLKVEQSILKKKEKLKMLRRKKEALKNENKLRNRKFSRKNKELTDVIHALKEESKENVIGGTDNSNLGIQGSIINAVVDDKTLSSSDASVIGEISDEGAECTAVDVIV